MAIGSRRAQFASFSCLALAFGASACGERFEIGEFGQALDPGGGEPVSIDAPLIADGPEDADAVLEGSRAPTAVGDVDGDGHGDWMAAGRLIYGRPRPSNGILTTPPGEGPTFYAVNRAQPAGDVDGDGFGDLIFGARNLFFTSYEGGERVSDPPAPPDWAERRAHLWYGRPERALGEQRLEMTAVALGGHDDLAARFQAELTFELGADDLASQAQQLVRPAALGDIDGDGYSDLGVTVTFSWELLGLEERDGDFYQFTKRERRESISYVYYGRSEPFAIDGGPEPDARLPGAFTLSPLGDVDGDGYGDVSVETATGFFVLAGAAQRLSGEHAVDQVALPLSNPTPLDAYGIGDLDRDGLDDFVVISESDVWMRYALVYGSAQLLQQAIDGSAASAVFVPAGQVGVLSDIGDWNGDGWTDLMFFNERRSEDPIDAPEVLPGFEVRLLPGKAQRYSGQLDIAFPDASAKDRYIMMARAAGDVDGDGMADVFLVVNGDHGFTTHYVRYGGALPVTPIR